MITIRLSSVELLAMNTGKNLNAENISVFLVRNKSMNLKAENRSIEISAILSDYCEGTLEYQILLDFINSIGGVY